MDECGNDVISVEDDTVTIGEDIKEGQLLQKVIDELDPAG